MKKHIDSLLGLICYAFGVILGIYVGGWKMLVRPILRVYEAWTAGELTLRLFLESSASVLLSTTLAGFIFCLGYIGYNHFKGIEDPDWDLIEEQRRYRDSTSA